MPEVTAKVTTLFGDNRGVILTNGWDRESRQKAVVTRVTWFGAFEILPARNACTSSMASMWMRSDFRRIYI
jgi:hypothetical protein